jgi:hypothetical protein
MEVGADDHWGVLLPAALGSFYYRFFGFLADGLGGCFWCWPFLEFFVVY